MFFDQGGEFIKERAFSALVEVSVGHFVTVLEDVVILITEAVGGLPRDLYKYRKP